MGAAMSRKGTTKVMIYKNKEEAKVVRCFLCHATPAHRRRNGHGGRYPEPLCDDCAAAMHFQRLPRNKVMIYKSKEEAKRALAEFYSKQEALEQAYGVKFEINDWRDGTWWRAVQYYDENQKERTLW